MDTIFNDKDTSINESPSIPAKDKKEEPDNSIKIPIIKIENTAVVPEEKKITEPTSIPVAIPKPEPKQQTINNIVTSTPCVPRAPSPVAMRTKCYSSVTDHLQQIHKQAQIDLLKQLLKLKNLNNDWFDVIMPLVWKSVDLVRPDVKHDGDYMDIRKYIKIKKLSGNYIFLLHIL